MARWRRSGSEATGVRALFVAAVAIVVAVVAVVARTGRLGYAIDDPYIHLAIAETLVDHGTFGIEAGRFESASSSPLWTLALAAGRLLGVPATWLPLVLATPFGVLAAWLVARGAEVRRPVGGYERAAVLLVPITLGVAPLVLSGMEHAAHVVVVLLLLAEVARPGPASRWRPALLAVGTALRLETAFVAAGLGVLTLVRGGDRRTVVRALAADALPVAVVVGAIGAANAAFGQHPLPNSIVAKAATDRSLASLPGDAAGRLVEDPLLLGVVVLLAVLAWGWRRRTPTTDTAVVVLVAATSHVLLADVGWFDRYQGYLVAGGVLVGLRAMGELEPGTGRRLLAMALVVAAVPRAVLLVQTPRAAEDIHRDQEQVARFLVEERPGRPVALNDIGYPAFLGAGPIIDVYGLADHELLDLRRSGSLDARSMQGVLEERGAELLIVFEGAFGAIVPSSWSTVERWCFPDPYVLAEPCIAFAAAPSATAEVRAQLDRFAPALPDGVVRQPVAPA